ncbi:MAG: sel1 repeat family protein, partial [Rhodocyclaceae bacterium]|nr:sel1 repeat family protein [Rhodocyclaceae bacterium]
MKQRLFKPLLTCLLLGAWMLPGYAQTSPEKGEFVGQAMEGDASALKTLEKAAEKGDARAQNSLGVLYDIGKGVPQDKRTAKAWYEKAAAQGFAGAQFNLGVMYRNGEGGAQDYAQAHKWFEQAAEQ